MLVAGLHSPCSSILVNIDNYFLASFVLYSLATLAFGGFVAFDLPVLLIIVLDFCPSLTFLSMILAFFFITGCLLRRTPIPTSISKFPDLLSVFCPYCGNAKYVYALGHLFV